MTIVIPEYSSSTGIRYLWSDGFEIKVEVVDNEVVITGNQAGLKSLATHLLTLAQDNVPSGCHVHYDEHNSLEAGSKDLILALS
ncbi:hypothetical protein ACFQT0_15530 [Hymenobacter humi]|uniref:Uncharacterized protein n=1 Tax=Hymenobacter humi TaxID=1411620 RepID=A0ABW2U8W0_9BACT